MESCVIINVNKKPHIYRRGVMGTYVVPPLTDEGFGFLVVRSESEVQDVGNMTTRRNEAIPARRLCVDILGEKGKQMGMWICEVELDVPKPLEKAEQAEREFLAANPGEVRMQKDPIRKMNLVKTVREPEVNAELIKLSQRVSKEREKFFSECRAAVTKKEVEIAKANLIAYYQQLCKDADRLWATMNTRNEVGIHHQEAAEAIGYEPAWASTPNAKKDCPACGGKIKEDVAICTHCEAVIDDEKARQYKVGPYKVMAAK